MTDDLQQQDSDSQSASGKSSTEQPIDWEARFKGLQREYNKLDTTLKGKEGYAEKIQRERNELEAQLRDVATTKEGEIVRLSTELTAAQQLVETERRLREAKEAEVSVMSRDRETRKTLADGYSDLIPWFDGGFLQIGDKSGDDLKTYLDGFRSMLGSNTASDVQKRLRGATPPVPAPSGGEEMSLEQLQDWLFVNPPDHKEYASFLEAYHKAVEKSFSTNK